MDQRSPDQVIDDFIAFLNDLPEPSPHAGTSLHVGTLAYETLRAQLPTQPSMPVGYPVAMAVYTGIPIITEPGFHPRRWELRRGDDVVQQGWLFPDTEQIEVTL